MCNQDIERELTRLVNGVRQHKELPSLTSIAPGADLRGELALTSLDLAELTVRIQDRFGVDVFAAGVVRRWDELCGRVGDHLGQER